MQRLQHLVLASLVLAGLAACTPATPTATDSPAPSPSADMAQ